MRTVRRGTERGRSDLGWLDSRHTFSFGTYQDSEHMGFRDLRVLNEDRVEPGQGFGTHPHRNMEILTYVLEGAIEHKDSLGTSSVLRPGEVQRMTAGSGVTHSEFNPSPDDPLHLVQVWIHPETTGLEPGYEQREIPVAENPGNLVRIASRDGSGGSLLVHQDVSLYAGRFDAGDHFEYEIPDGRHVWLQLLRGSARVGDTELVAGDGLAVSEEERVRFQASESSEVLLFDLR